MKFLFTIGDGPFFINAKYNNVEENHKIVELNSLEDLLDLLEKTLPLGEGVIGLKITPIRLDKDDEKAVKEYYGEEIKYEIESYGVYVRR